MSVLTKSVAPAGDDFQTIRELERAFAAEKTQAKLIAPNGLQVVLPETVHEILHTVLIALARGQEIRIVPTALELTTQQAAELLNVSRTFLCKLLESGEIPFHKVGSHRRIRAEDVLAYQEARDNVRRSKLKELTKLAQEMGGYD